MLGLLLSLNRSAYADVTVSPQQVVSRYCELEFIGARFDAEQQPKFDNLVSWPAAPAVATRHLVIDRFAVVPLSNDAGYAEVAVDYWVIGILSDNQLQRFSESKSKRIVFRLHEDSSGWRIHAPRLDPHVSLSAVTQYLAQAR